MTYLVMDHQSVVEVPLSPLGLLVLPPRSVE